MSYFEDYFTKANQAENANIVIRKNLTPSQDSKKSYIDIDNLVKIIFSWLMGGAVSLMPTFIYIWSNPLWREQSKILEQFFSNKDLFLVITTLTAGTMFEVFCSHKKGFVVPIFVTIGIMLMVFSLLIFSLLLFQNNISNRLHELPYIGVILLGVCFLYSIVSYVSVCWKGK